MPVPPPAKPCSTVQPELTEDRTILQQLLEIYSWKVLADHLSQVSSRGWNRKLIDQTIKGTGSTEPMTVAEIDILRKLLPQPSAHHPHYRFRFIDLFAGIGGIRSGFEEAGGKCVFTSEWNKQAIRTYKANWYCDRADHTFNQDIREITLSDQPDISRQAARENILQHIPDHEVLLAGFPCQPFSLAGVSKKNSLGRTHGFECQTQGTLFFDVAQIISVKQPAFFVLENVKNLKSHDKGNTFKIIQQTLDELGYDIADINTSARTDPTIIDGKHFLPQHRERIVLVGFRRDLALAHRFTLRDISQFFPVKRPLFRELLDEQVDEKYVLTPKLWHYLYHYAKKHRQKGNGFGFGLVSPEDDHAVTRTLSARYYKDGSEILVDRGWDTAKGELDFNDAKNMAKRPRRLTPRECARLMGFEKPGETAFRIPVSDTQAYRQFGNSVVVSVFSAIAQMLLPYIQQVVKHTDSENR